MRGLLIDAHYGLQVGNAVRTDLSERSEQAGNKDRELYLKTLGPEGLAAIGRIRDRVLPGEGKPGVFLCHRFCELGATELTGALRDVREFLVEHPDEVLIIVIEDYVLPSAIVTAFEESGLAEKVYRGPPAGPFPTLREMIDSGRQVVVYAENHGGGAPWYTAGYDGALQETPFTFKRSAQLTNPSNWPATCVPNRGTDDAPLFLINHWINTDPTPRPSDAAKVNARPVLVGRARAVRADPRPAPDPTGGGLHPAGRPLRRGRRSQRRRVARGRPPRAPRARASWSPPTRSCRRRARPGSRPGRPR